LTDQDPTRPGAFEDSIPGDIQRIIETLGAYGFAGAQTEHGARSGGLPPINELPEWGVLIGEQVRATPGAAGVEDAAVEAKRTGLSVACVIDAYNGDNKRFPGLSPAEWQKLHKQVKTAIPDNDTLEAFLLLLLTHDFGKNEDICRDIGAGADVDHDEVYSRLVTDPANIEARRRYMPSFDLLSKEGQRLLTAVARLRTNYPQSLQGEAPAATLEDFHTETDQRVKALDILKAKFDIFGAAGHANSEVSLTATSATARRMHNLDTALLDPNLATPQDRNNAFLDAEIAHFMHGAEPEDEQQQAEWRALARLECTLRVADDEQFAQLREAFDGLSDVSKTVLVNELNRPDRATLAYYSPILLRTLAQKENMPFALEYFAHILQEAHIADQKARRDGLPGISVVQAEELVRGITSGTFNPRESTVRFLPVDGALVGSPNKTTIDNLNGLPTFDKGEQLRGKRVVFIGEGGGSDGIQAAMVAKLMAEKYGCETAAVVSTRNTDRQMTGTGEQVGEATRRITPQTEPVGDWRFLEKIPTETDPGTPMYVLNHTATDVVNRDVTALAAHLNADVVIGIDTGGDSLYRSEHPSFSAHLPTDITPDHDYSVIQGLAQAGVDNPQLNVMSVIVAPGVDSPSYGREMLDTINAQRVPLTDTDVTTVQQTYAAWGMDGSGSEQGRYGKTPLAWLHALSGRTGFQRLDLPRSNVTSNTNPWRAFTTITEAMAGVVIADMQQHAAAIRRDG